MLCCAALCGAAVLVLCADGCLCCVRMGARSEVVVAKVLPDKVRLVCTPIVATWLPRTFKMLLPGGRVLRSEGLPSSLTSVINIRNFGRTVRAGYLSIAAAAAAISNYTTTSVLPIDN